MRDAVVGPLGEGIELLGDPAGVAAIQLVLFRGKLLASAPAVLLVLVAESCSIAANGSLGGGPSLRVANHGRSSFPLFISVYPPSLNSLPTEVSSGQLTWQLTHSRPVWRGRVSPQSLPCSSSFGESFDSSTLTVLSPSSTK
jgi:hypothetical protein